MRTGILLLIAITLVATSQAVNNRGSQAIVLSTLSVCVSSFNAGLFNFFTRRGSRTTPPPKVEEMSYEPNGPVSLASHQAFSGKRRGGLFSHPLHFGGTGNMFQQLSNLPGLSSIFQRNEFQRQMSRLQQQQMAERLQREQLSQFDQQQILHQMQQHPDYQQNSEVPDFSDFRLGRADDETIPGLNDEEAESFFSLLAETDESQCISRLICEMGADPSNSAEFGQTVNEIISNLRNFPPGSKVAYFNQVLLRGRNNGLSACVSEFSTCDEESYQLVKNAQMTEPSD